MANKFAIIVAYMTYAVIKSGGKQYRVSEGDIIEVDSLGKKKDDKVVFDSVLLLASDSSVKIGKPVISGEKVEGVVLEETKGDKLHVLKYKAKVRYRRKIGFRPSITRIKITKISGKKETKAKETKAKPIKTKKESK